VVILVSGAYFELFERENSDIYYHHFRQRVVTSARICQLFVSGEFCDVLVFRVQMYYYSLRSSPISLQRFATSTVFSVETCLSILRLSPFCKNGRTCFFSENTSFWLRQFFFGFVLMGTIVVTQNCLSVPWSCFRVRATKISLLWLGIIWTAWSV